jgi:hypothetical protein
MPPTPPAPTYFFLSYARADDSASYAQQFHEMLHEALRSRLGAGPEKVLGFIDQEMLLGSLWPVDLLHHLRQTATFIPLYSPTYFAREFCGREWYVMEQRIISHRNAHGGQAPNSIIPIVWEPVSLEMRAQFPFAFCLQSLYSFNDAPIHEPASPVPGLPVEIRPPDEERATYERFGLLGLFRYGMRRAIAKVVDQVVEGIQRAISSERLETDLYPIPDLSNTINRFAIQALTPNSPAGVRKLHILIVAQTAPPAPIQGPYRDGGGDLWQPYDGRDESAALLAQRVADQQKLVSTCQVVANNIASFLAAKRASNELVLVVIDPDTLGGVPHGPLFENHLHSLFNWTSVNVITYVLWDGAKRHAAATHQIKSRIDHLFYDQSRGRAELYVDCTEDPETFQLRLRESLERAKVWTAQRAEKMATTECRLPLSSLNPARTNMGGASGGNL